MPGQPASAAGLPGPTGSHWVPLHPTGSHRVPAGATGSRLVPPGSSPQSFPRPPWRPRCGGFVDVTVTHGGRERVPVPTWDGCGTPCSPQLPSPARDGPILREPRGSGPRLGSAVPDPGHAHTRSPELPSRQGSILPCSGHSRFRGGISSSSVSSSKGLCAPRGCRHRAPPATAGTGTAPLPTPKKPLCLQLPPVPPSFSIPAGLSP